VGSSGVFVTGGTGYIGRPLVAELRADTLDNIRALNAIAAATGRKCFFKRTFLQISRAKSAPE